MCYRIQNFKKLNNILNFEDYIDKKLKLKIFKMPKKLKNHRIKK
jgi:hypothetical protein